MSSPSDFTASRVLSEIYGPVLCKQLDKDLTILGLLDPRTPEERAAMREQGKIRLEARHGAHLARLSVTTGTARAVLDLHEPDEWLFQCEGCDYSGYEGEPPDWPCRTYRLVCESEGLTLDE